MKVPIKYSNFLEIFLLDTKIELADHTGINEHTFKFFEGTLSAYDSIYSPSLGNLETLKTYIKTHLKQGLSVI